MTMFCVCVCVFFFVTRMNAECPVESATDGAWLDVASALRALRPTPSNDRIRVKISGWLLVQIGEVRVKRA